MKIIDLEQGSPEWLAWRRSLLTATDAAMLLDLSPYVTPYQGWQRKLGLIPEQVETQPMRRGKKDEPIARALFIQEYGINMTPYCVQSSEYDYIGASLDGLSDCKTIILEIKSQRPVREIPLTHKIQMYHQMMSTDLKADRGYYVSHWEGVNTTFELEIDKQWVIDYLPKAKEFWGRIILFDPPEMSNKDYLDRSSLREWRELSHEYIEIDAQMKILEAKKAKIKCKMIEICQNQSSSGCGIKLVKKNVRGKLDYKEIVNTLNVIFEDSHFRKPSTESWAIMVDRN